MKDIVLVFKIGATGDCRLTASLYVRGGRFRERTSPDFVVLIAVSVVAASDRAASLGQVRWTLVCVCYIKGNRKEVLRNTPVLHP